MSAMADRPHRGEPIRGRIKTLTQAAMNADVTVGQLEEVLAGLGGTINGLDTSMVSLNATLTHLDTTLSSLDEVTAALGGVVGRLEAIAERVEYLLGLKDIRGAVASPLAAAESAVRTAVNSMFWWARK